MPRLLAIVLGATIGLAAGVGGYTFLYAKGAAYLTDDPAACANCHLMREQLDGWIKSSHRAVAVCNDCHMPAGFVPRYLTKVSNGFRHSFAFTTGRFLDEIRITPRNREIAEGACRKCHQDIVWAIEGPHPSASRLECVRCHASVGHLE